MTCMIIDCQNPNPKRVKGYCVRHYQQVQKHGKITDITPSRFEKRPAIIEGDIAKIPLGINAKDGYATVDRADAWLAKYQWYKNHYGYAVSDTLGKSKGMHRIILEVPDGLDADHIDRNRLNNRRSNLRIATRGQNLHNKTKLCTNTTGYKGVCYDKSRGKYMATINGRYIGRYPTPEQAAQAYNIKAKELHGEFALLNDIPPTRTLAT